MKEPGIIRNGQTVVCPDLPRLGILSKVGSAFGHDKKNFTDVLPKSTVESECTSSFLGIGIVEPAGTQ